jgi:hypothetical protein
MTGLKIHRIKSGLTQMDLFLRSGVPQWRSSLLERGLPPKPDEAERIASALGVKYSKLFGKGIPAGFRGRQQ